MRRSEADIARTRAFWAANRPLETAAPALEPSAPVAWRVAVALAVALVLQATVLPPLALRGAVPSLVVLLAGWYGVRAGVLRGFTFGLVAGACEDALAGTTGVAWTFATALAAAGAGRLHRTWLADTKLALVPGAAAIGVLRYTAFAILMRVQARPLALPAAHVKTVLVQAALDAAIAYGLLVARPQLGGTDAHRR